MLKLKTTFHIHFDIMDNQIKKIIADKYVEQVAKCVLTDINENSKQSESVKDSKAIVRESLLTRSKMSDRIHSQNGMEVEKI